MSPMAETGLALRGEYVNEETEALHRKIMRLEAELSSTREALADSERQVAVAKRVLGKLRGHLQPQYETLQVLFGQLESAGVGGESSGATQPIPESVYSGWKQRLSPACGKVIDALLVQPMTHTQLNNYCKAHYETIRVALNTLKSNSLVEKNGNVWSLKR